MQVEEFLEISAERFPEKVALIVGSQRLTYRYLDEQANRVARSLMALGVVRGDRVAICLDNSAEAVLAIFGTLKAGGVFVLVDPGTRADKLIYTLNNCRANCFVCSSRRFNEVQSYADKLLYIKVAVVTGELSKASSRGSMTVVSFQQCLAEGSESRLTSNLNIDVDLAALMYTSASTGNPKGVMLTHLNIISAATSITTYLENRQDDVILSVLPLAFDYGLYQVLMGFKIGGTVVLERSFTYPQVVLEKISQEKVTGFPMVPTIAAMLLDMSLDKYDFSSLRYLTNTAAVLPIEHIMKLRRLFPEVRLFSMYGLTECKRVSYLSPDQLDRRPSSVGKGMPNQEVYLVDEQGKRLGPGTIGELVVRGAHVMKGYWDLPDETARVLKPGAWPDERVLHTGDLFRMDEEGFLYFLGRIDDMIKTSGRKVSPREVENVLHNFEGIAEAAVIGVPHPILGQIVKAVVRLRSEAVIKEQDIRRYCVLGLEDFMVPKIIEIVPELPKTDSGKIDKRMLQMNAEQSLIGSKNLEVA